MDGEHETTGHHSSMRACTKVSFPLPLRSGSQEKCYPEKLFFFFKKVWEWKPPKGHPCGYFKLSGRSQTTISHEILSKTKVYVFLFTTWLLPKSKKEHRLSALKNHPVLSLHYRIITHLLYKVRKKSDLWFYFLAMTPCNDYVHLLPFNSWFTCHFPPQYYIPIFYISKHSFVYMKIYTIKVYSSIILHLNYFPSEDYSN